MQSPPVFRRVQSFKLAKSELGEEREEHNTGWVVTRTSEGHQHLCMADEAPVGVDIVQKHNLSVSVAEPEGVAFDEAPFVVQRRRRSTAWTQTRIQHQQQKQQADDYLAALFDEYDADGDGKISTRQVNSLLKQVNIRLADQKVLRRYLDKVDTNRDGMLDLQEFKDFLRQLQSAPSALVKAYEKLTRTNVFLNIIS